jgi:hypothetical protein
MLQWLQQLLKLGCCERMMMSRNARVRAGAPAVQIFVSEISGFYDSNCSNKKQLISELYVII